jgi:Zn-dependent peptidase ImmA (M78 family)
MSRADVAARALIDRFDLDAPPVDLDKVAAELGVIVVRKPVESTVNGMLMCRDDKVVVGLNEDRAPESQRFALAHLIGHHQIHRRRELLLDVVDRYSLGNLPSMPTDREEAEANRFAAALLAPESIVRKMAAEADFRTARQLVELLAPRFEVADGAMSYRLMMLGIVMDH